MFSAGLLCLVLVWPALLQAQPLPAIFVAEQQAVLAAERPALLKSLPVKVGEQVEKGQLLAVFDSGELERDLATSRAQRNYLLDEITATERLIQQGMAKAGDLAKLKKDADIALANILWLKGQASRARLTAPFSGTVVALHANAHEWLQTGQPLLKLVAEDDLSLVTSVQEQMAANLQIGTVYLVKIMALKTQIKAKLTAVLPQVDVQSGTVDIRLKPLFVDGQAAAVFPGMRAQLSLLEVDGD
jgi:RND family efflux transporter MFP subunit